MSATLRGVLSELRAVGQYDRAQRRRSVRKGRERGCWVYIPLEELQRAGIDGDRPWYRTVGTRVRGARVMVNLYREP
jgi:hypothetical protein